MKVRYWRETTDTEFYETWPETDRNEFSHLVIVDDGFVVDNDEDVIMQWDDDDE